MDDVNVTINGTKKVLSKNETKDTILSEMASLPTSAQADAIYFVIGGGTDALGMSYTLGRNDKLVGYNVDYDHKESEITENVTYKIIPVITLYKDVKIDAEEMDIEYINNFE